MHAKTMSKRPSPANASRERSVSPPPPSKRMKGKVASTATKQAVASFFTPVSKKGPERLAWRVEDTLLIARYKPGAAASPASISSPQPKRRKIAAFDFDSTLISTSSGNVFGRSATDWKWWHPSVPTKLRSLHSEGYHLAILSNQGGINLASTSKAGSKPIDPKRLNTFKEKVGYVLGQLDLPVSLYAATVQDGFRKPRVGMWRVMLRDGGLKGVREGGKEEKEGVVKSDGKDESEGEDDEGGEAKVDLAESLFVGDAAGRLARGKIKADHSASDRGFAENVGIKFYTPEEYFLSEPPAEWKRTFDPLAYIDQAADVTLDANTGQEVVTTAAPVFTRTHDLDIVLLVGSPGSGKSTFYRTHLAPLGYARANQDTLKTREKCLRHARASLEAGESVCVDNTNADEKTRADWVALAREAKVPIRCVWLQAPPEVCRHNDVVRSIGGCEAVFNPEGRSMLPGMAFSGYASRFKAPRVGEGFVDVLEVPFGFRGGSEERRVWGRYWV